jgi:5-methylcytosine-specific restriction endonuclease McrA
VQSHTTAGDSRNVANPRNTNGHRRRILRKRVLAHYTNCAICGLPVDKTLPVHDPGAPEVDEILPVSLGGDPLAWRNVQLAHRLCNQQKGNKTEHAPPPPTVTTIQQPVTSRAW